MVCTCLLLLVRQELLPVALVSLLLRQQHGQQQQRQHQCALLQQVWRGVPQQPVPPPRLLPGPHETPKTAA